MSIRALALSFAALFEPAQATPQGVLYTVTRSDVPAPGNCLPTGCSLREAFIAANANPGSTIALVHGVTYTLSTLGSGTGDATTDNLNITANMSPMASSGLSVAVTSLTTSVCSVSSNLVTLLTMGTCTLRASQPGNGTYAAAPTVNRSFTIKPMYKLYLPAILH